MRSKRRSPASAAQGDSGVSTRLFGTLLTWLSDRTSDVFFVGTCNDISKLPPEFARAERWDGVLLPRPAHAVPRRTSSGTCTAGSSASPIPRPGPTTPRWTGAEIKSLLPAGGAARRHADPGRPPRRAGRRHGRRAGGAAALLGQRPLSVGLQRRASTAATATPPPSPAAASSAAPPTTDPAQHVRFAAVPDSAGRFPSSAAELLLIPDTKGEP